MVGGFIVFVSVLLSPVCGPTGSPQLGVLAVCPMVTGTLSATVLRVVPQIDPSVKLYNHGEGPY